MRKTQIGGQAVLEGVMMRGVSSMATAVRDADGEITVESKRLKSPKEKSFWYKVPVVRGVLNFVVMMKVGVGTLMRSSEVFGEVAEPSKFETWLSKKLKVDLMDMVMTLAVILGLGLAVVLFMLLPSLLCDLLFKIPFISGANHLTRVLIEGVLRIAIFVLYVLGCSRVNDVKRVFMYHGAEHKTINAFEHDEELTVENVQKYTTVHKRCGTTFMFLVMVVSIVIFALATWLIVDVFQWTNTWYIKLAVRLVLLPLVAGVSYEILKLLALSDNILVRIIRWPGLQLQRLTTKEPDDSMVEVAIAAFNTVFEMDANDSIAEKEFDIKKPYADAVKAIKSILPEPEFEAADTDWIFTEVLGVKRAELAEIKTVKTSEFRRAEAFAKERATHRPLQYVLGSTEFFGRKIEVQEGVLIPRPETELLAEEVVKCAEGKRVLDLCTGSGAIAVAVKLQANCTVTASDISDVAIETAKRNAELNDAEIEIIKSDLFENIEGTFDIIVSNPPYIPSADIAGLMSEVKDYEPLLALDGGIDGLDIIRRIAEGAKLRLNEGGLLALEIGVGQAEAVVGLLSDYADVTVVNDYDGIARIVKAFRRG